MYVIICIVWSIMMEQDSAKCIGDEHLKRISVSFDSHKFILTTAKSHVYIVKIPSDDN